MNDRRTGLSGSPERQASTTRQSGRPPRPPGRAVASGELPAGEPFPPVRPITPHVVAAVVSEFGPEALDHLPELRCLHLVGHAVRRGARSYRGISALLSGWAVPGEPAYDLPHSPAGITRLRLRLEKFFAPVYGKQFRLFRALGEGLGSDGLTVEAAGLWRRLEAILGDGG